MMRNRYEVTVWGKTFADTDVMFSLLIRADSPEHAAVKAAQILISVMFSSCVVAEVELID